jgi:hypothetical protein
MPVRLGNQLKNIIPSRKGQKRYLGDYYDDQTFG